MAAFIQTTANLAASAVQGAGAAMSTVGLGTWKIPHDVVGDVVYNAIKLGYRHLDCACDYGNEAEVGEGIRRAIDEGIVTREDLWVTSKLWNTYHAKEHVRPAIEKTLSDLGLDYVDLYLIHFPISLKFVPFETRYPPEWVYDPSAETPRMEYANVSISETWGAMEELVDARLTRSIGVCNFGVSLMRDLLSYARIPPAVLQLERHPYLVQQKLLRACDEWGVHVTGFSPLGAGSYVELNMAGESDSALNEAAVGAIAGRLQRTPAQVLLRWGLQRGQSIIPKTSKIERLAENLALFDFELTADDMEALDALDKHRRFNDPGEFTQGMNSFCPIYE